MLPSVAEQPLPPVTVTLYLLLHTFLHGVEDGENFVCTAYKRTSLCYHNAR